MAEYVDNTKTLTPMINVSGVSWSSIFTTPTGKTIAPSGMVIINSAYNSKTMGMQIINNLGVSQILLQKLIPAQSSWILNLKIIMQAGWSIQACQQDASSTGSAYLTYSEV